MKTDVPIKLLVTDKGVKVIDFDTEDDRDRLRELIYGAVMYDGAKVVEIREITVTVDLPETPVSARAEGKTHSVPQDVRDLVEEEMKKRGTRDRDQAWDILMDALSPGLYRVTKEPGMRGLKRED
jgi:hypothetical protein